MDYEIIDRVLAEGLETLLPSVARSTEIDNFWNGFPVQLYPQGREKLPQDWL